jgi:hypothetical protein
MLGERPGLGTFAALAAVLASLVVGRHALMATVGSAPLRTVRRNRRQLTAGAVPRRDRRSEG